MKTKISTLPLFVLVIALFSCGQQEGLKSLQQNLLGKWENNGDGFAYEITLDEISYQNSYDTGNIFYKFDNEKVYLLSENEKVDMDYSVRDKNNYIFLVDGKKMNLNFFNKDTVVLTMEGERDVITFRRMKN